MTNTTANNSTRLSAQNVDPVEELAAEARSDLGDILKFVKGKWLIGDSEVPKNTEYVAHVDQLIQGWVRFDNKKIVERILARRTERLPERDELSFTDEHGWPRDNKGAPRDPWVKQYYLPLVDTNEGAVVTFVTATVGGRMACGKVCDGYLNNDRRRPIVALDVSSFASKDYGKIDAPLFRIISFEEDAAEAAPASQPVAASTGQITTTSSSEKKKSVSPFSKQMDDEIPF
jgi:hypothetical protein